MSTEYKPTFWKWVAGVLVALLMVAVGALGSSYTLGSDQGQAQAATVTKVSEHERRIGQLEKVVREDVKELRRHMDQQFQTLHDRINAIAGGR